MPVEVASPVERLTVRSADGTGVNVEVRGPAGAPTVVLVHGWTCSAEFWAKQYAGLGDRFRIVAPDLRGHGRSERPGPAGYAIEAVADDLAAVLRRCAPAGERVVVAGHSMGAMALVALGARHPGLLRARVAAALLVSTGVQELVTRHRIVPMPLPLAELARPVAARVIGLSPNRGRVTPRTLRFTRYVTLSRSASAADVEFCARIIADCPPEVRAGFARTLSALDLSAAVAGFDVPARVLAGTRDRLTPVWHARGLAERLPRPLGLVEVQGAGHMTPVEAPAAVDAALRDLVRAHLLPARSPVDLPPSSLIREETR